MQIIYVGCSYATVYLMYAKFKATYDGNHDTFRVEFLVVPVGGLAFLVNHDFSPLEVRYCVRVLFIRCSYGRIFTLRRKFFWTFRCLFVFSLFIKKKIIIFKGIAIELINMPTI